MNVAAHNGRGWDIEVLRGNPCTRPVSSKVIRDARLGRWSVRVTGTRPVPAHWWPPLTNADVLCLGGGGGQQGPILAAVGANVTVLDLSAAQLEQDRKVACRDGLSLRTLRGDMSDLRGLGDESFDLIVLPVSTQFVAVLRPVWRGIARILRSDGIVIAGFVNSVDYCLDRQKVQDGALCLRHALPYSDLNSISSLERSLLFGSEAPIEFGHTLTDQIGGQLNAGLSIVGFFEDIRRNDPLSQIMPTYFATKARKWANHLKPRRP